MRFGRFRFGAREAALSAASFAILVSLLILWLGHRHDLEVDRLVAEGKLAQGEYLSTEYGSASRGRSDLYTVRYRVDGVEYRTSAPGRTSSETEPIFEAELIRIPRLGPEKWYQVVYLPTDPSVSRLRADMKKSTVAAYGAAGMFMLIGLVFGAMGLFVIRKRRGLR